MTCFIACLKLNLFTLVSLKVPSGSGACFLSVSLCWGGGGGKSDRLWCEIWTEGGREEERETELTTVYLYLTFGPKRKVRHISFNAAASQRDRGGGTSILALPLLRSTRLPLEQRFPTAFTSSGHPANPHSVKKKKVCQIAAQSKLILSAQNPKNRLNITCPNRTTSLQPTQI